MMELYLLGLRFAAKAYYFIKVNSEVHKKSNILKQTYLLSVNEQDKDFKLVRKKKL